MITVIILTLYESQVVIYVCEQVYIEAIAIIKYCTWIPFLGCCCPKSGEQMDAAKNTVHPNNTHTPASILSQPCHLIHLMFQVQGSWK